jgi:hypothetical protein
MGWGQLGQKVSEISVSISKSGMVVHTYLTVWDQRPYLKQKRGWGLAQASARPWVQTPISPKKVQKKRK